MNSEKTECDNGTIESAEQEMSGCTKFKQNAWKKELCSNCYRPKEEHKSKKSQREPPVVVPLKPAAQGILSLGKKSSRRKKKSVRFPKEESEVIGYGGLDNTDSEDEDDFEFERSEQPTPLEREVVGDDEKALERLTKSNTDFNSSLKNLNGNPSKSVISNLLGKQQKQTLQVTIQPFSSSSTIAASRKSHLNKLLEDEDPKPAIINGSPKEAPKNPTKDMDQKDHKKSTKDDVKPSKEVKEKGEVKCTAEEQNMPNIKTIVIESKKEERGTPEGRKTHIQRGSIVTKAHEQAKNKLYVQNGQKNDKRASSDDKNNDYEDVNTIVITTNGGLSVEENNEKNLKEPPSPTVRQQLEPAPRFLEKHLQESAPRYHEKQQLEPAPRFHEKPLEPAPRFLEKRERDEADHGLTKVCIETEEVTVKVLKLLNGQNGPPESREMAGEPDGKADSDEHEQETPITPPPRSSFLHREMGCSPDSKPPKPLYSSTTELKMKPAYPTPAPEKPELKVKAAYQTPSPEKPELKVKAAYPTPSPEAPELKAKAAYQTPLPEKPELKMKAPYPTPSPDKQELKMKAPYPTPSPEKPPPRPTSLLNLSSDVKTTLEDSKVVTPETKTSLETQPEAINSMVEVKNINDCSPEVNPVNVSVSEVKKPFNGLSMDLKKTPLNGLTLDLKKSAMNGSCPDIRTKSGSPEKPSKYEIKTSKHSPSSPEKKSTMSKASSMFNSWSSEFKSFKSLLSSPTEGKVKGLPPTPLTMARSASPPPALPTTPPPAPSPSISSVSSTLSSKPPSLSASPLSSLEAPTPPLPTTPPPATPPPQPTVAAPTLLNGSTAPVNLPALTPLQIPSSQPPLTPSDDVPVLQEVARKRPAPKPPTPVDAPPEPLPRRRNSSEAKDGHGTEKKKTRMRQTLRKLWRFGSREEEPVKVEEEPPAIPRPRPQIIHPLDLNKSAVQVLPAHSVAEKSSPDSSSSSAYSCGRPTKPPPPPRSESLNLMERLRPRESPNSTTGDNVYVNIGEGRCGITPVKPQRTGSMRDAPKPPSSDVKPPHSPRSKNYSNGETTPTKVLTYRQVESDHVYECVGISSGPDKPSKAKSPPQPPASSPSYSMEEEIYYPYVTFQNGECKTVMKRGVVTQSLEENYGAVIIKNLQALTHLLKQVSDRETVVPIEIQAATNLHWSSFEFADDVKAAPLTGWSYLDGSIGGVDVTLLLGSTQALPAGLESWGMFSAVLPERFGSAETRSREVTVLKRSSIERFISFAKSLEKTVDSVREGVFLLLQIIKFLSRDAPRTVDTSGFVVLSSSNPKRRTACYLPPEGETNATCQDAAYALSQDLLGELALGKVLARTRLEHMTDVLEVWLWGPAGSLPLQAIKRWLDLERANLLQSLVTATPSDRLDLDHLSFLVHTNASRISSANQIILS